MARLKIWTALAVAWLRLRRASARNDGIESFGRTCPTSRESCPALDASPRVPGGWDLKIRGDKQHWMGDWPPTSFGHFGMSGSLMLLNARRGHRRRGDEYRSLWRLGRSLWPRLDECGTLVGAQFVSSELPRVGLDLDGSLESLGNSMTDLADALDATHEIELVRFHSREARQAPDEARLAVAAALGATVATWPRDLDRSNARTARRGARRGSRHTSDEDQRRSSSRSMTYDPLRGESREHQRVTQLRRAVDHGALLVASTAQCESRGAASARRRSAQVVVVPPGGATR